MRNPLRIGHRGAKAYVTENTIASIEKALELGVDGIEIDVHLCASGELVVFHDVTLDRMTNGTGEISGLTLQALKALKVKDVHHIPTLEEVLLVIDQQCMVNIELKGVGTAKPTMQMILDFIEKRNWNPDLFLVSSFQHKELEIAHTTNPLIRLGVLTKASVSEALTFATTINAYAIHPNVALLTKTNVQKAQSKGFKVMTWTVNDAIAIERMKDYGVDGIISDNPDLI